MMRVVWSLLRGDNCVGDEGTVMMMIDSVPRRLYIIAEGHIAY